MALGTKLMAQRPIPVVMCSSLTEDGSQTLMQALEAGAVDVILKPRVDTAQFLREARVHVCDAVKAAAQAQLRRLPARAAAAVHPPPERKLSADVMLPPPVAGHAMARTTDTVVCIGASTGGTELLRNTPGRGRWKMGLPRSGIPLAEARWRPRGVRPTAEPDTPDAVRSGERSNGVACARRFPAVQDASVARHDRCPGRAAPEQRGE